MTPEAVVSFWQLAGPSRWFTRDAAFDGELSARYRDLVGQARSGFYDGWARNPEGALALILVLDQFSRNIHRGTPLAFAADARALALARRRDRQRLALGSPGAARLLVPHALRACRRSRRAAPRGRTVRKPRPRGDGLVRETASRHHPALRPLPAPQRHSRTKIVARRSGLPRRRRVRRISSNPVIAGLRPGDPLGVHHPSVTGREK